MGDGTIIIDGTASKRERLVRQAPRHCVRCEYAVRWWKRERCGGRDIPTLCFVCRGIPGVCPYYGGEIKNGVPTLHYRKLRNI